MKLTLDEVRKLLEKATPGEWHYQEVADRYTHIVRANNSRFLCQFPQDTSGEAEASARLTASAPSIARLALEQGAEIERLRYMIQYAVDGPDEAGAIKKILRDTLDGSEGAK